MSPPNIWGPRIWTLFHTFIEKMKEEDFPRLSIELFYQIKRICGYLPCPDCSQHATLFFSKVKKETISTKNDFKNMLYFFHNQVNFRKGKPTFPYGQIDKYKNFNIIQVYNQFISVYHNKGNMKMLTESFQRQFIIQNFKQWFLKNRSSFTI
jgi:hypothetical protein